jgi:hypothetical protein
MRAIMKPFTNNINQSRTRRIAPRLLLLVSMMLASVCLQAEPALIADRSGCVACAKLNALANRAGSARGNAAVEIIAQTGDLFQDLVQEQPVLEKDTARDLVALVVGLLDEDKMQISIEALRPILREKKNREMIESELRKIPSKRAEAFRKARQEVFTAKKPLGNG